MNTKRFSRLGFLAMLAPVLLVAAACSLLDDDDGGSATQIVPAPIDELELVIRESAPPQYAVRIVSGLPSGCAVFHGAEVTGRDGNTITISVTNTIPADPNVPCTAIYGWHESIVELGTDFVSGETYTVNVNDKTLEFTAQ